jgi:kumamolisin
MALADYTHAVMAGTHPTLAHKEFSYQFGATDETINIIQSWANNNNLTVIDFFADQARCRVTGTVAQWNAMFGITLTNLDSDPTRFNYTGELIIPAEIKNVVISILGLDTSVQLKNFARVAKTPNVSSNAPLGTSVPLTPAQVAKAYQFPPGDGAGYCIGIIQLGGGFNDLNLASTFYDLNLPVPAYKKVFVDGQTEWQSYAGTDASLEVMLDIAVSSGIVNKALSVSYFSMNTWQGFVDCFHAAVFDGINLPYVISCSWGLSDIDAAVVGTTAFDNVFQSATTMGKTIVAASGDTGSENYSSYGGGYVISVLFPASSPYVTGVGGTTLQLNSDGSIYDEFVWNTLIPYPPDVSNVWGEEVYASGGGESYAYYPCPPFQSGLSTVRYPSGRPGSLFRRGVPDVAANADPATGYSYYHGQNNAHVIGGGTSAAAPLWAALIILIKSQLGYKSEIGCINPILYANTYAFRDITVGDNFTDFWGATDASSYLGGGIFPSLPFGYSATPGWDACTGLGTPIGTALVSACGNTNGVQTKLSFYDYINNTNESQWRNVSNVMVKTDTNTWGNVLATYTKTVDGWLRIS